MEIDVESKDGDRVSVVKCKTKTFESITAFIKGTQIKIIESDSHSLTTKCIAL